MLQHELGKIGDKAAAEAKKEDMASHGQALAAVVGERFDRFLWQQKETADAAAAATVNAIVAQRAPPPDSVCVSL